VDPLDHVDQQKDDSQQWLKPKMLAETARLSTPLGIRGSPEQIVAESLAE
jgi:hypothetical protein